MDFGLSEQQHLLQRTIADFLDRAVPISRVRSVVDGDGGEREIWSELAEQGVTGVLVESGGSGLGLLDAVVVAQELGRHATPCSFHTACVAAPLLLAGVTDDRGLLARIAEGETLVSVALDAPSLGGDVAALLAGVPDADLADGILVYTGSELHYLPAEHPGVAVAPMATVDGTRRIAEVRLEEPPLGDDTRLEPTGDLSQLVDRAVQATRIVLAADILGACQRALAIAVEYSLERRQFDRVIGSFQAVKHLCAETVAAVDPVQSLLWYAAFAWDQRASQAPALAALLKSHASEVGSQALSTTTQVMGGIGFTHECDMHLYYKRVGYDRQFFGGPTELRALAAGLRHGAPETGAAACP